MNSPHPEIIRKLSKNHFDKKLQSITGRDSHSPLLKNSESFDRFAAVNLIKSKHT